MSEPWDVWKDSWHLFATSDLASRQTRAPWSADSWSSDEATPSESTVQFAAHIGQREPG